MATMALPAASRASPAYTAFLIVALLCAAASVLPRSSADASFIAQTCHRTPQESLCVSVLQSINGTSTAATVQELAVAALLGARRAALRAKLRSLDLGKNGPEKGTPVGELLAQCDAIYSDCLRAGSRVVGSVSAGMYGGAADAAGALRLCPARCEGLFQARRVASPMEAVDREMADKMEVAYQIVRLLP